MGGIRYAVLVADLVGDVPAGESTVAGSRNLRVGAAKSGDFSPSLSFGSRYFKPEGNRFRAARIRKFPS
jgi:hypothetical protein